MKSLFLTLLLVFMTAFCGAIDAYIVAGQSNGWRLSSLKEGAATTGKKVHYFGMKCVSEPDESVMVTYRGIDLGSKGAGLVNELLAQSDEDIVLIQYCRCGAPVTGESAKSWWPGEDPKSGETFEEGLFGKFPLYLQKARAQIQSELGEDLEIKGLFWHQGESNVNTDKKEFEDALRDVFWRFREITGKDKLPIVAGHIRDLGDGSAGVNAALDRIAADDPMVATVPLSHLTFEPDRDGNPDVHIATEGCHELGRQMFGVFLNLLPKRETFMIAAPSRIGNEVIFVEAQPLNESLILQERDREPLNFSPTTIAKHPFKNQLYVTSNRAGKEGGGAVVEFGGSLREPIYFEAENGYSYLSLDRRNRFLLGSNYGEGIVDVYSLGNAGIPESRVATLSEGRKNAHCVLLTPDNRFAYIPYVKDTNALFQYSFDEDTGALSPLDPLNANPPEGTGPRHLAYHPNLPILYFSNEQHLGVSVYDRAEDGPLTLKQVCDIEGFDVPEDGVSSSDIVITEDGRFLFAGIRGHKHDFDFISRYEVLEDGKIKHLGLTPADKIPWGLALSPDGKYLLATGFGAGTLMAFQISDDGELTRAGTLDWDEKISDLVAF